MNDIQESKKTPSGRFFQGIGVICGRIKVDESQNATLDLEGELFELKLPKALSRKLLPLLEKHPDKILYLRVYPRFNPKTQELLFKVVTFHLNKPESDPTNQFLLAGIWQYIPQLPDRPVMSIYRNSLREGEKAAFIKNNHLPVQGFTEEAYRHQVNASEKGLKKRKFYQLLVRLNPQQRAFEFLVMLDSSEEIPTYIKKEYKKPKQAKRAKPAIKTAQMNFSALQKAAIKLRQAGFLEGKVSGKGVTKDALSSKIQDSLRSHPGAAKVLR